MSVEQMRAELSNVYPSSKWILKVKRMPDAQVIAMYNSFLSRGKFNKKQHGGEARVGS